MQPLTTIAPNSSSASKKNALRLDAEIDAFHEYMANLNKAKDREEFDRFMRDRNSQPGQGFSQNN